METKKVKNKFSINQNVSTILFLMLFILLFSVILTFATPNFLNSYNIGIIIKQMSFFE